LETFVNSIDVSDKIGKEIVLHVNTDLQNEKVFLYRFQWFRIIKKESLISDPLGNSYKQNLLQAITTPFLQKS